MLQTKENSNVVNLLSWKKAMTKNAIDRLDELMQDRHWKQADLARALGSSPQAISSWWTRGVIPGKRIAKVAQIFGVSVDYLMVGAADGNQLPEHFDAVYQELTQAQQDELLAEATKMAETNQQALAIAKELQARKK